MNCSKCGTNLGENDVFCPKCGTQVKKSEGYNANIKNEGMYNYERPVNQQMNGQNNINTQQNGDSGKAVRICVIIGIVVAILAAVSFLVYTIVSALNYNKNDNVQSSDVSSVNETSVNKTSSNTSAEPVSSVSNTQKSSTYKVNYAGFKLYIPDDLIYELDSTKNAINIGDSLSTWVAQLSITKVSFQQLKQNKNNLSSYFTENLSEYNAKVSNVTVETIDGVEFILVEMDIVGTHEILALTGLNSMYTAVLEIANENNDYDRDVLKNLTPILKSAEYEGESKSIESKGKLNTTDINKALQKATEQQTNE